jgi:hypothetical protein
MTDRIRRIRAGSEPLLARAFWLLSVLELPVFAGSGRGTKRERAAKTLNVDERVLSQLGELTSTRGDGDHPARNAITTARPLTEQEQGWLYEVLGVLALRVAVYEAGGDYTHKITMADLPRL